MERRMVELFLQGKSNREVARQLKAGDRKVRRARALAETYGYLSGQRALPVFPEATFPLDEPAEKLASSVADELLLGKRAWMSSSGTSWPPVSTRCCTRATLSLASSSPMNTTAVR